MQNAQLSETGKQRSYMNRQIKIAIGSTASKPGEVAANLRQITGFAEQAGTDGAALLLTPEMSASGYGSYPEVLATAEHAGKGLIYRELAQLSAKTEVVICAGFVEEEKQKRYISHYVVYPNGDFLVQRKNKVTGTERPLDSAVHSVNDRPIKPEFTFFTVCDVKCAITICADNNADNLAILAKNNVELLLVPCGAGGERKDRVNNCELRTSSGREKYLKVLETVFFPGPCIADCIKYNMARAAVNLCGYDGQKHYHVGHGMIITSAGEVPGFFHGLPNLDRQRPMYASATVELEQSHPK